MKDNNNIANILDKLGILKINEPLKNYSSFRTGGPADFVIWPKDADSLKEVIFTARECSLPLTVLGGCTNLLVGDIGIRGIVVMMNSMGALKGRVSMEDGLVYSDASVKKDEFIRFCLDNDLGGMEFMAGIPGCIGGGIIMNAGTVDGNFAGILDSIVFMDNYGEIVRKKVSACMTGYRKMDLIPDSVVLGAFFRMNKTDDAAGTKAKISAILEERKQKHPLNYPSAGSVFKNPAGHSSWKLINDSGLRGRCVGGACVSELHTNFIINKGGATSRDILDLIGVVRDEVGRKFNIMLEPEIKIIGGF